MKTVGLMEQTIGASLIVVILALVLTQVAQRYIHAFDGWPWTGEVPRLALVWCTFALSGYLMAQDRHITIKVIDLVLRERALGLVKLMSHLVVLATCLGMGYATYRLIVDDIGQRTPAAEIPLALVYVMPLLGYLLTALRAVMVISLVDSPEDQACSGASRRERRPAPGRHRGVVPGPRADGLRDPGSVPRLSGDRGLLDRPRGQARHQRDQQLAIAGGPDVHPRRRHGDEDGDRRPPLRRRAGASRPAPGRPRLRQHRRKPRVLVDERGRARGRRGHRIDRGRPDAQEGLPGGVLRRSQRQLGADQPHHAPEHPGGDLRVGGSRIHGCAVHRGHHPRAPDDGHPGGHRVRVGTPQAAVRGRAIRLERRAACGHPGTAGDGRPRAHPRRHPRRLLHAHRGSGGRSLLHARPGPVVSVREPARPHAHLP